MALERSSSSELDFESEWQKQAETLATLFAKELGLSKEEYIASLPKFEPQPEAFKGRFDIPVIVETRIPLKQMLELAGISYYFYLKEVEDWEGNKFTTPRVPYSVWLQDGRRNVGKSVREVRRNFPSDERGATVLEGIALYLRNPKILEDHYLDFPGSLVGPGLAPYLYLGDGLPRLDYHCIDHAFPEWCSVSRGRV